MAMGLSTPLDKFVVYSTYYFIINTCDFLKKRPGSMVDAGRVYSRFRTLTTNSLTLNAICSSAIGALLGAIIASSVNNSLFEISETPYCARQQHAQPMHAAHASVAWHSIWSTIWCLIS